MKRRGLPEINAGSMADIAFLLLIFFLVTTTMDVDTGLVRKLPAMPEEEEILDDSQIKARTLTSLPADRAQERTVKHTFQTHLCNPYVTSCRPASRTHSKLHVSTSCATLTRICAAAC